MDDDETLSEALNAARKKMQEILDRAKADDNRDLTDDETAAFDAEAAKVDDLDGKIRAKAEEDRKRAAAAADRQAKIDRALKIALPKPGPAHVEDEPVYRKDVPEVSYFRDLYRSQRGDHDALDRLVRNNAQRLNRAISTVNGSGGEFVPPLWLENDFVKLARPGRPFANALANLPLPAGTDAINIPKVAAGTAVAIQGTQNSAVQQTDLTTTSVAAPVITLAGGQTVSMQLIDQGAIPVDRIVLQDLALAYAQGVDNYVLNDTNQGVIKAGTQTAVTGTATGASAGAAIYSTVSTAIGAYVVARHVEPTLIVMHPRRWYWYAGLSDANNRPFIVPNAVAYNPVAQTDGVAAEGVVGHMLGLPVMLDSQIPTNLGTGTNQDAILLTRPADLWLFEGSLRAEAFPQTYAQNLSLFVRLYNYLAFTAKRYPESTTVLTGTQLSVLS